MLKLLTESTKKAPSIISCQHTQSVKQLLHNHVLHDVARFTQVAFSLPLLPPLPAKVNPRKIVSISMAFGPKRQEVTDTPTHL